MKKMKLMKFLQIHIDNFQTTQSEKFQIVGCNGKGSTRLNKNGRHFKTHSNSNHCPNKINFNFNNMDDDDYHMSGLRQKDSTFNDLSLKLDLSNVCQKYTHAFIDSETMHPNKHPNR